MPNLCRVAQELPLTATDGRIIVPLPQDSETAISQWRGLFQDTLERFTIYNSYAFEDEALDSTYFGTNECIKRWGDSILGDPYEGPPGTVDYAFSHAALAYLFPTNTEALGRLNGGSLFTANLNGANDGISKHSSAKDKPLQEIYGLFEEFVQKISAQ